MQLMVLKLKVPKESENTPEQTAQLLSSLSRATSHPGWFAKLSGKKQVSISLEVTLLNGQVTFICVCPKELFTFVSSQFQATYPDSVIEPIEDYLNPQTLNPATTFVSIISQEYAPYFPLRDYADYKEVDPMLPLLGVLSKAGPEDRILIQFVIYPASPKVQSQAYKYLHPQNPDFAPKPEGKKLIDDKLSQPLTSVSIRFVASRPDVLRDLEGAVSVLNRPDSNNLKKASLYPWDKKKLLEAIDARIPYQTMFIAPTVLNVMELSSLWHLPGVYTKIPNIAWSPSKSLVEPPENLPIAGTSEDINVFAKTVFRNQEAKFGLKLTDRLRHVYVLGKSGTGKSTLLENMAVDDFKKGRGVAFIDPHGDTCENLLNYIPKNRQNDVVYFNPSDREYPISINIMEVTDPDQAELVASSIVAIFHKLYGHSWGPRLEYILRNAVLTLTLTRDSTLPDVVRILTDDKFRKSIYPKLDPDRHATLLSFWQKEFDSLEEKTRIEQISSILNKIGQFVNSPLIHDIIKNPKSSISLSEIIDSGKILIVNLSQGKLGEDNAALLGAMLITKIQLSAMNRVNSNVEDRKHFFLYVDEFQNFATESFVKILSEARKFKLGLILANQYIAQIPEEIQKGIFGNAGTIISFVTGAEDSRFLSREFSEAISEGTLTELQRHQIAIKMTIDNMMTQAFLATTLPPLASKNQNKDKIIALSRSRYSKSKK